ncbi:hypothetical protein FQN50_002759 [Emmonsiellopsis sp. PD_5]|nr:hypothetical protein FQN50_002759 [Emmonsiellopsis sp. PD_5]
MPTEEEFAVFDKELREKRRRDKIPIHPFIAERFPAQEDQLAYLEWVSLKADKHASRWYMSELQTQFPFVLETINYNYEKQRGDLANFLDSWRGLFLYAGIDINGDIYRIVLQPDGLLADQPLPKTDCELVPPSVLGVNLNVQPRLPSHRRVAKYEESTQLNQVDDFGDGFVFHQIGMLEMWICNQEDSRIKGPWRPTNFGVVVRIHRSGAPIGVYIIYDFYPMDPARDPSERPSTRLDIPHWGMLGNLPGRIAVAKIADTMSVLQFGYDLSPAVIADYPVELVRAAVGWGNSMHQLTIMYDN